MKQGLVAKAELSRSDLLEIKELSEICCAHDNFEVKLNWDMLADRSGDYLSDFFYYQDGRLTGYVELDSFGAKYEVTGLVLPEYRRQGIFRQLLSEACQEARQQQPRQLLLVGYQFFPASKAVAEAVGGRYDLSEYQLKASIQDLPPGRSEGQLELVEVKPEQVPELAHLLFLTFHLQEEAKAEEVRRDIAREGQRYFFARLGQETIGHIGVINTDKRVYIRAVGIMQAYRGKGYGRQLLETTLQQMIAEGNEYFELEVVTQNREALSLYLSCGFKEANIYDYYRLPPD